MVGRKGITLPKILFVGPYPPPVNGQSNAFKMAYDHYEFSKLLINQNFEKLSKFHKLFSTLHVFGLYIKSFFDFSIEVIYLSGSRSLLGAFKDVVLILIFKLRGIPIINHVHAANFDQFLNGLPFLVKQIYLYAFKKVDVFICLLEEMQLEYLKFSSTSKTYVVHNFYDPILDKVEVVIPKHNDVVIISYFSNLMFSKGIFILLDAFELIHNHYLNIELHIAGGFSDDEFMTRKEVQIKFEEYLKRNSRIKYFGSVYDNQKIGFLLNSDLFVLPTFYKSEAFPISILEAMRTDSCIITTQHHYLPNLISERNGQCVKCKSVIDVSNALLFYIDRPELLKAIQEYNINYATESFNVSFYLEKIDQIIEHVRLSNRSKL